LRYLQQTASLKWRLKSKLKASLESNADTQAVLKIVCGAEALSEQSLTNNIISERDDYVAGVEPQDYVTVRIEFGNATHVHR